MIPDERSLVDKMKGKPFALVGVNSDVELDRVKPEMTKAGVTWRSFWNGPKGPSGPIAAAWGVTSWPTIVVLDSRGMVRYRNIRGSELERAVEALLGEL
jgi:hypothetical protein